MCDRKYLPKLITTLYFGGVMIGGVVFGHLADRVGRQPMVLTCLYAQCAIGVALHFVASLHLFIGMKVSTQNQFN